MVRKVFVALAVLLLVLGGALALVLVNLNSYLNDNRDWIAEQAKSALGRDLSFGEVGVSILGGIGARVAGLRVADDPAYAEEDFLSVDDALVRVRFWPALQGRVEVSRIVLRRPTINVIRDANGFNFQSIAGGSEEQPASPAESAPAPSDPAPGEPTSEVAFFVSLFDLEGATVRFVDRTAEPVRETTISDLDVTAENVGLDTPIDLAIAARLLGSDTRNLALEGTIGPLQGPNGAATAVPVDMQIELGPLVVDQLRSVPGLGDSIPKELSAPDPIVFRARAKGTPDKLDLTADMDLSAAAISYGDVFRKPGGVPLRLSSSLGYGGTTADIRDLLLVLSSLELRGKGTMGLGEKATFDLTLASNEAPLGGWEKLLPVLAGPELSGTFKIDARSRGSVGGARPALDGTLVLSGVAARMEGSPYEIDGLSTTVRFEGDQVTVPPTTFRLGGSEVELGLEVRGLDDPTVELDLASARLRAASLALAGEGVENEETLGGLSIRGDARGVLSDPQAKLQLRVEDGMFRDLPFQKLVADLNLENQVTTLRPLSVRAFEGSYRGSATYDQTDPVRPRFKADSKISDMDLRALLESQMPMAANRVTGTLQTDLNVEGSGAAWEEIQQTLTGGGRLEVEDGAIEGINLADEMLSSVTGIGGLSNLVPDRIRKKYPEVFGVDRTKFDQLSGTVRIADGKATTDDLTLAARDYTLKGRGVFELRNHADFTATLVLSEALTADIVGAVKEARYITDANGRLEIPARIAGPVPDLKPQPDTDFIVKALGRAALRGGIEALLGGKAKGGAAKKAGAGDAAGDAPPADPGKQLLEKGLQKGLEGLFGR